MEYILYNVTLLCSHTRSRRLLLNDDDCFHTNEASYWSWRGTSFIAELCGGHSFTLYLYIHLDIGDLEVASPHILELLEDNNQTT